jgi:hypothetical protein
MGGYVLEVMATGAYVLVSLVVVCNVWHYISEFIKSMGGRKHEVDTDTDSV